MGSGSSKPAPKKEASTNEKKDKVDDVKAENKPQESKQNNTSQPKNVKAEQENIKHNDVKAEETIGNDDNDEPPAEANIKPETTPLHGYEPGYADFPTSTSLKYENVQYVNFLKKQKAKVDDNNPSPNAVSKADIFDLSKFSKVDERALQAPTSLLDQPLEEAVKHLIQPFSKEIEQVRVLFRWAAAQNLEKLPALKDTANNKLSLWHFHQLQKNFCTHGDLFESICKLAGIRCITVKGTVKAKNYEVGDPIDFSGNKNDWNIVRINNVWKHLDLNFASRSSTGGGPGEWELMDDDGKGQKATKGLEPEAVIQTLNESYFLTNPEEFIFTHFPVDRSHQLLARSVTDREFEEIAYIWSSFFDLGLQATQSSMKGPVDTIDGEIDIDIKMIAKDPRRFMYQLYRSTKDGTSIKDFQGYKFNQFVFIQQKENSMKCKITFPIPGKYKLEFFSKDSSTDGKADTRKSFDPVAKYLITCEVPRENWKAFPENKRMEWGPGNDMTVHGITPITHKEAVIESDSGLVQLKFKTDKDAGIIPKLRSNKKGEEQLKQFLLQQENNGETTVDVKLPDGGSYALDIYGKADADGNCPHLCTYLLDTVEGADDKTPYPDVPSQKTGATASNEKLELVPLSHKETYFTAESGEVELEFKLPKAMEFTTGMSLQKQNGKEEIADHIFTEQKDNKVKFKTRFPKEGAYQINIYAKEKGSEGGLPNVYNYVVNVPNPKEGCKSFPEVFGLWGDGCQVSGNQDGVLPCEEDTNIKVSVPGAKDVAVIGKDWTKLTKNKNGEWEGTVRPSEEDKSMQLSAAFDDTGNFGTLLRYKTKSKKEIEAEKKEQERKEKELLDKKKAEEERQRKAKQDIEDMEKELKAAIEAKDLDRLKKIVIKIEKKNCTQKFLKDYETAKELIKSLERLRKLQVLILEMNQATMAEIRSYKNPPVLIHDVMIASLLLIGDHEGTTKEWKKCQALCNSNELKKRVRQFKFEKLHPEIAARARQVLSKYRLDDVRETSGGAACFYAWVIGMVEELNITKNNILSKTNPASLKRQKEICKN